MDPVAIGALRATLAILPWEIDPSLLPVRIIY